MDVWMYGWCWSSGEVGETLGMVRGGGVGLLLRVISPHCGSLSVRLVED